MLSNPQVFRFDDLIGGAVFKNPVLVNAGGVGESIGADNGLVGLDRDVHDTADHPAGAIDVLNLYIGIGLE